MTPWTFIALWEITIAIQLLCLAGSFLCLLPIALARFAALDMGPIPHVNYLVLGRELWIPLMPIAFIAAGICFEIIQGVLVHRYRNLYKEMTDEEP